MATIIEQHYGLPGGGTRPAYGSALRRQGRARGQRFARRGSGDGAASLARALGWFSIGLGLAELAAPRAVARLIGVAEGDHDTLLRALGAREIASGLAILAQPDSAVPVWSRVAGDVMDLALLSAAFGKDGAETGKLSGATLAVLGVAAADAYCAMQLGRAESSQTDGQGVPMRQRVIIDKPADELYRFWRDFANLPRFMTHLVEVQVHDDKRSRWTAKAPMGGTVSWEAEVTDERQDESISWRSLPGADVDNEGVVRFARAPGGRGTVVTAEIRYRPPGGALGATVAKLFGEAPEQQIREDLRRFKRLTETGEIPTTEGQPHGRRFGLLGGASAIRMIERTA